MYRQLQASQDRLLQRMLHDREYAQEMGGHELHAELLRWLTPDQQPRVLELGCGPGKYVGLLANSGFQVVGVDPCEFPTWADLHRRPEVELKAGVFGEDLPYPDASFDAIVCLSALLYFDSPYKGMQEMRRVLKPGGRLILRTVNRLNYYTNRTGKRLDPASRQLYSPVELNQLVVDHGFKVEHSFTHGFWPPIVTNFWWYLQCVWIPHWAQTLLSRATPNDRRVNCTVICTRI
jgi:SAM-dependent methyltransferase